MAIKNYICEKCEKVQVCKINDILAKFHEEAKKDLGVDIKVEECRNYSSAE
jgi:hypothetical protein